MKRILHTRDICVSFGDKTVLDHVTADFEAGVMTAIIGSNGVGKTTYLKAIAQLTRAQGKTELEEDGIFSFNKKEIAYVPQLGALQTRLTVFEMVLLGLVSNLKWHVTKEQTDAVWKTLQDLGIEHLAAQPFHTLSGGQKQLVSMAQSLIGRPKVLLLDEPTSALDLKHQLIVMDLAERYTREQNVVTLFVVHDLMLASRYGSNLLVLHNAGIYAYDRAEVILRPELIAEVYGVRSRVLTLEEGYRMVLPLCPLEPEKKDMQKEPL